MVLTVETGSVTLLLWYWQSKQAVSHFYYGTDSRNRQCHTSAMVLTVETGSVTLLLWYWQSKQAVSHFYYGTDSRNRQCHTSTMVLTVETGSVTLLRTRTCLTIFHSMIYLRLLLRRDPLATVHIHWLHCTSLSKFGSSYFRNLIRLTLCKCGNELSGSVKCGEFVN